MCGFFLNKVRKEKGLDMERIERGGLKPESLGKPKDSEETGAFVTEQILLRRYWEETKLKTKTT